MREEAEARSTDLIGSCKDVWLEHILPQKVEQHPRQQKQQPPKPIGMQRWLEQCGGGGGGGDKVFMML